MFIMKASFMSSTVARRMCRASMTKHGRPIAK